MATIKDYHNPWRDALLPAMFDGCPFFVESSAREGGRRSITFQFPKRDVPYTEDMGRRAIGFTVRAYCVSYPVDSGGPLYMRDYRIARDILQQRLDKGGYGVLQLPNMARATIGDPLTLPVVCERYRLTEDEKAGGYCQFDLSFIEFGLPPVAPAPQAGVYLRKQASGLYDYVVELTATEEQRIQAGLPSADD